MKSRGGADGAANQSIATSCKNDRCSEAPSQPFSTVPTVLDDTKYAKRRRQKQQELFSILMLGAMCLLLLILAGVLASLLKEYHTSRYRPGELSTGSMAKSLFQSTTKSGSTSMFRRRGQDSSASDHPLLALLEELEDSMQHNLPYDGFLDSKLLVAQHPKEPPNPLLTTVFQKSNTPKFGMHGQFFRISRLYQRHDQSKSPKMGWREEWDRFQEAGLPDSGPPIDYTRPDLYQYSSSQPLSTPPTHGYPQLRPLGDIFQEWPQDEFEHPPSPIEETLQHFDFQNAMELEAALKFRDRKLPFKYTNVPELLLANQKWTDEYVSGHFDRKGNNGKQVQGRCQESRHAFFAFFVSAGWNVEALGLPPTRNNDWTFQQWSEHAKYADSTQLPSDRPHFYWQAGVPKEERELPPATWTFVSTDLPSFSSPDPTVVCHDPSQQKGIQCRFGERGVTAATHYDAGRNMIGMIQGAKRYILHPPNQCFRLGIVTSRNSTLFRHSLLNFQHLSRKRASESMSQEEQDWLHRASQSKAVQTVVKAGEILFVPSHWFHYIISLQQTAQCNVRSGVDMEGDEEFGGADDVEEPLCDPRTRLET